MTEWQKYRAEKAEREREYLAEEERHAEQLAEIASLKASHAELREFAELQGTMKTQPCPERGREVRDVLTWLPAYKANDYAQAIVAGESIRYDLHEAWENVSDWMEMCRRFGMTNFFLDLDHDCVTRAFELDRLYFVPREGIYCDGVWTREGMKARRLFIGVSPAWLYHCKKFPPPEKWVISKQREWEETQDRLQPDNSMACLGAVCIRCPPTFSYYNQADLEGIKSASGNETNITIINYETRN